MLNFMALHAIVDGCWHLNCVHSFESEQIWNAHHEFGIWGFGYCTGWHIFLTFLPWLEINWVVRMDSWFTFVPVGLVYCTCDWHSGLNSSQVRKNKTLDLTLPDFPRIEDNIENSPQHNTRLSLHYPSEYHGGLMYPALMSKSWNIQIRSVNPFLKWLNILTKSANYHPQVWHTLALDGHYQASSQ